MPSDGQASYSQQIEHLLTTVVTCRSVVKYNLPLSDEQKHDLMGDIDTALEVLRSFLVPAPASAAAPVASPSPWPAASQSGYLSVPPLSEDTVPQECFVPSEIAEPKALSDLYRMYHALLSAKQPININTFVVRFNDAMTMLHEIQQRIEVHYGRPQEHEGMTFEETLHRVRVFIADLYYIFMEFIRALSDILQKHNVQLDTEKLTTLSVEQRGMESVVPTPTRDLAPLFGVYEAHQRLNEKRGLMSGRIGDAAAFLEFLKESLNGEAKINKQDEILFQIHQVGTLLRELSRLLGDYEQATATLFVR
jgi:hypothetical protein